MEFPAEELLAIARLLNRDGGSRDATLIRQAVGAYSQLSDRCVRDRTELSLEIANLRARLKQVDPSFPANV